MSKLHSLKIETNRNYDSDLDHNWVRRARNAFSALPAEEKMTVSIILTADEGTIKDVISAVTEQLNN